MSESNDAVICRIEIGFMLTKIHLTFHSWSLIYRCKIPFTSVANRGQAVNGIFCLVLTDRRDRLITSNQFFIRIGPVGEYGVVVDQAGQAMRRQLIKGVY